MLFLSSRSSVGSDDLEHDEDPSEGDQVIRYPTALLKDDQPVQAAGPAKSSMAELEQAGASQPRGTPRE